MPVENGIGHSEATIDKQFGLEIFLRQHLAIVREIQRKYRWADKVYRYIDANAGSGRNEEEDCDGSPIIFRRVAEEMGIPYYADLIEIDEQNAFQLRCLMGQHNHHSISIEDNASAIPDIISNFRPNVYGLLYTDPNGIPNFDMLTSVSRQPGLKRIDILIRCPACAIKRNYQNTGKKLTDYLSSIDKKHWIIKEPFGAWQWTFLVGLNWPNMNVMRSMGFHYTDSKTGQQILDALNFTRQELTEMRQPRLFEPDLPASYRSYDEYLRHPKYRAIRSKAIDRCRGICEQCGQRGVTEVHHIRYPRWGQFDVVDNLLAVCHQCHCNIHGKEN